MKVHSQAVLFTMAQQRTAIIFAKLRLIDLTDLGYIDNPFTHDLEAVVYYYDTSCFIDKILTKLIIIFHNKYAEEAAERLLQYDLIE